MATRGRIAAVDIRPSTPSRAQGRSSPDRPSPESPPDGSPDRTAGLGWLWLSAPLAALSAVAAAAGILFDSTYERDAADFATQGRAQDCITLFVAVPLLLILWRWAARGSLRARLLWQGVVFYLAYTYVIAAFMVRFNNLFLVYTSAVGCAVFALLGSQIGLAGSLEPRLFDVERWPRRGVVGLLAVVVVGFAGLWLADVVPALLDGVEPESLAESGTPTNGVQVIDLSFLIPGAALVAHWVRRSEVRGQVLATGLLAYVALLSLALVAMVIGQYNAGFADSVAPAVLFALLAGVAAGLLARAVSATAPSIPLRPSQPSGPSGPG